jgi:hypothetical protein
MGRASLLPARGFLPSVSAYCLQHLHNPGILAGLLPFFVCKLTPFLVDQQFSLL